MNHASGVVRQGSPWWLMVKRLPAMWETWVQSLGWEDPLEEGMATHSSILAWRIPMDTGAWRATVHGVTKSRTQLKQLSTHCVEKYPVCPKNQCHPSSCREWPVSVSTTHVLLVPGSILVVRV